MRETLTVLAILLIVVLTTALVGPYFVDWNAHRGEIEKRLSALLGADVAVTGPIDVKLLPRPIFRLGDVAVHGRSPRDGTASATRVDMELSLTALLRGEVLFVEADITAPQVILPLGPDRSVRLPAVGADAADRISLVHVVVRDGTLTLREDDGRDAFSAGGIAGEGEAESLIGPFKFAGRVDTPRGTLGFRIATGSLDKGRLRLKVGTDAGDSAPRSEFDGFAAATTAAGGGAAVSLDGTLITAGARALPGGTAVIPWRASTTLHAEPGRVTLTAGELRAGADGRALIATLAGDVDLGASPAARLTLRARQADLGRLAVSPESEAADAGKAPSGEAPSGGPDLGDLAALATDPDLTTALPLPVVLDYGVDTVAVGSLTLGGLSGRLRLAPGRPLEGTLSLAAADGSRLALDGSFEPGPAAVYKGRVEAASAHLQRLAASLGEALPQVAASIGRAPPIDDFSLTGAVDLSGIGFAAHDVVLGLDRSRFAGTITLTRAVGQDRARLFADVTSDALDLDTLPDWRDAARAAADLDVSLTLAARATRLASDDTGSVTAGRIALQLQKSGSTISLDRLSLADVGGATADLKGRSDGTSAHAEGRIDAKRLHDVVALADRLAPGVLADGLLARADALSPALLSVTADASVAADGTLAPTLLSLEGTAAGTAVALHLRPSAATAAIRDGAAPPFALDLTLDAPDTGALLRQVGVATAPATAVGRGRIDLSARRDEQGTFAGKLTANLGGTTLTAEGGGTADRATARATLKGANVAPLARALLLATPEAGTPWPLEGSASFTLKDGRVTADGLSGRLLGTPFSGSLAYVLPPAAGATPPDGAATAAALTGNLSVDRVPLATLMALVIGPQPPPKPGAVWPEAPFATPVLSLPRSEIALTAANLPLLEGLTARNGRATLRLAAGALTVADLSATLKDGRIGGTATLRRDGASASLSGHAEWSDLPMASPALAGLSRGSLDLAGTGTSIGAIMGSLAGSGTVGVADTRLPRFDPGAITQALKASDAPAATVDAAAIADQLAADLDRGALSLGPVTAPVTVAAGVLRSETIQAETSLVRSQTAATLDLRSLALSLKATASLQTPPKDWTGAPPEIGVLWRGPFAGPTRAVDAANLVNGIAARAIARDQARIEAFQDDIRERAFFARRLRAIEAEQQAARDKAKADADAERLRLLIQGNLALPGPTSADAGPAAPMPILPVPPAPARAPPLPPRRPGAKPLELH